MPGLRDAKALSVGAKMVMPWFDVLSWVLIWSAVFVLLRSLMKVVY